MRITTHAGANSQRGTMRGVPKSSMVAERAYQCLTIAFMFLLLASL